MSDISIYTHALGLVVCFIILLKKKSEYDQVIFNTMKEKEKPIIKNCDDRNSNEVKNETVIIQKKTVIINCQRAELLPEKTKNSNMAWDPCSGGLVLVRDDCGKNKKVLKNKNKRM